MDSERGYQHGYADINPGMYDWEGRRRKAETMLAVLRDALGDRLASARVLNLGCSAGLVDEAISPHVDFTTGIDIDAKAISVANARSKAANSRFFVGDAMALDLADESFDVVICSQVYEHVPDPARMMSEIRRVLVAGGVCYFAATSRWSVVEMHYKLPFLSWVPTSWADRYLQATGRGTRYYERHLGPRDLRTLVSSFDVVDFTPRILDDPARYAAEYMFRSRLSLTVARWTLRHAYPLFPGFIWLLRKPTLAT
jgi:SAM-dependent methyltransferase